MALDDGDLSRQMFNFLEMEDGRLDDGRPISMLFFTSDPVFKRHLDFGSINPLAFTVNDPDAIFEMIGEKTQAVLIEMAETTSESKGDAEHSTQVARSPSLPPAPDALSRRSPPSPSAR